MSYPIIPLSTQKKRSGIQTAASYARILIYKGWKSNKVLKLSVNYSMQCWHQQPLFSNLSKEKNGRVSHFLKQKKRKVNVPYPPEHWVIIFLFVQSRNKIIHPCSGNIFLSFFALFFFEYVVDINSVFRRQGARRWGKNKAFESSRVWRRFASFIYNRINSYSEAFSISGESFFTIASRATQIIMRKRKKYIWKKVHWLSFS